MCRSRLVRTVTQCCAQLSQAEYWSVIGLHKTQLCFSKNICSKLTWLQLFPAVFSQCFLAPFLSSGCSEGNEWQCCYLICIKSITSPFPSPAVIHSPLPALEKIEGKEREEGICVQEQWLGQGDFGLFGCGRSPLSLSLHMLFCLPSNCSTYANLQG